MESSQYFVRYDIQGCLHGGAILFFIENDETCKNLLAGIHVMERLSWKYMRLRVKTCHGETVDVSERQYMSLRDSTCHDST